MAIGCSGRERRWGMRFDAGKAWPHPVLRPPSYGDDYPHAEFEVEIEIKRITGSTAIEVAAEFQTQRSRPTAACWRGSSSLRATHQSITNPLSRLGKIRQSTYYEGIRQRRLVWSYRVHPFACVYARTLGIPCGRVAPRLRGAYVQYRCRGRAGRRRAQGLLDRYGR